MTPRYFIIRNTIGGSVLKDAQGEPLTSFGNDSCALHLRGLMLAGLEREGHAVIEEGSGRYLAGARLETVPPIAADDATSRQPNPDPQAVVLYGNPIDGFKAFGPFANDKAGADWGEAMGEGGEFVMPLHSPADAPAVLGPFLYPALFPAAK